MIKVVGISGKMIVISGIGKLFYQEGFPIPMAINKFYAQGYSVSIIHIADELLKNGWSPKTVYSRLEAELTDQIQGDVVIEIKWDDLKDFCYASYEEQRDMIFKSLFYDEDQAKNWLNGLLYPLT